MSDYDLSLTGAQIDAALNKVHNVDAIPVDGSANMVTSDGVHDAVNNIQFTNLNSNLVSTDLSTGNNNTTIPTTQAVANLVSSGSGITGIASSWTTLSTNPSQGYASGTASSDGFILFSFRANDNEVDGRAEAVVGGITYYIYRPAYGYTAQAIPISNGETWSVQFSDNSNRSVKFKAFS